MFNPLRVPRARGQSGESRHNPAARLHRIFVDKALVGHLWGSWGRKVPLGRQLQEKVIEVEKAETRGKRSAGLPQECPIVKLAVSGS